MTRLHPWLLSILLCMATAESWAHLAIRAEVPPDSDYAAAAAFVRSEMRGQDAVTAAPAYVDPIVRMHMGDAIGLGDAGRSDLAAYAHLWGIGIGGAQPADAPTAPPDMTRDFGAVRVTRWTLPTPSVRFDFTAHAQQAEVTVGAERCPRVHQKPPRGGGLGKGVLPPAERFTCAPREPHQFVAPVVMEDLGLLPRHCLWMHPAQGKPLQVTFRDVPLGEALVIYAGLYYEHERMGEGTPVRLDVQVDGKPIGHMLHRDGDGWAQLMLPTGGGRGDVRFAVTTSRAHRRGFCVAASTRGAP